MLKIKNYLERAPILKEHDFQLLSFFTIYSKLNPNEVFQKLEKIEGGEERIAPNNIRERIERLHGLGLLESIDIFDKIKKRQGIPTYYKLSEEGLFVFFLDFRIYDKISSYYWSTCKMENNDITYEEALTNFRRCIYLTHSQSDFFRFFLNSWISNETLLNLNKSTLFIIGFYLSRCCKIVKNLIDFFLFGTNENKKKDNIGGFNNPANNRYYDFESLMDGEYVVEDEPFLSLTDKIFSLDNKMVKIKRLSEKVTIILDLNDLELLKYEFDFDKKILNVRRGTGEYKENLVLSILPPKKLVIPFLFPITVDQIFSTVNVNEAIISIMASEIEEGELVNLAKDIKFKSHLIPLKELFINNCNKLLEKEFPLS